MSRKKGDTGRFLPRKAAMLAGFWDRKSDRPSVRPSVLPSVTRVLCDETKEHTADILIPHERISTLVFLYQQKFLGDILFL